MIPLILSRYAFQLEFLRQLVDDVPEDRTAAQPAAGMNHPAWLLGHLAWASDNAAKLLGLESALDESWAGRFSMFSRPLPDAALYPDKATLLGRLADGHARLAAALPGVSAEILAAPMPMKLLRKALPTVGDALVHVVTTHEAFHIGQLSAWRRAMNMGPAKMMYFA